MFSKTWYVNKKTKKNKKKNPFKRSKWRKQKEKDSTFWVDYFIDSFSFAM